MKLYEGLIVAKSPIHSGSDEKLGNESALRRMTFLVDGKPMEIPVVSGNSIRGILRRKVMRDMLTAVGYQPKSASKYTKLHHILFSGGVLEAVDESESGYIDLALKKKLRDVLPPLSVFGAAMRNQMIESKLSVSFALPVCRELSGYLPEHVKSMPQASMSIYSMLADDFITRKDDLRDERAEDEQAVQMLVNFEVFAPGTVFYHRFALRDATPVEEAVLGRAIELWRMEPFIGARAAIGYGTVELQYPLIETAPWREHLASRRDEILETLASIEA